MTERRRTRFAGVAAAVCAIALMAVAAVPVEQTDAAWVDREYSTSSLVVRTLPAPDFRCTNTGVLLVGQVGFEWVTPPTPYPGAVLQGYTFTYARVGGTTTTTVSLPATATSAAVPAAGLELLSSWTVTLTARYQNWNTPVTTRTINVLLGALGITIFTCG